MLVRVRCCAIAVLLSWAACTGIAPDPQAADATRLPVVELTQEQREAVIRDESAAILAVSRQGYANARRLAERVLAVEPRSARAPAP